MGTYTANYNLFMPTIGEQGWGELVNGNFIKIDAAMKSLNNSILTLETADDAFDDRITALEAGNFDGNVSAETFNGDLYVNLSSTSNFVIGTYTVFVDDSAASKTYTLKNKGTYGTVSLTITDIQTTTIKGFKINNVSVVPSITYNMGIGSIDGQTLYIYKNDVLVSSKTTTINDNGRFTASTLVSVGDVLSGKVYNSKNLASGQNVIMSISLVPTGDLYFA